MISNKFRKTLIGKTHLTLTQADLTKEKVKCIVNAANSRLKHGGGLARAIVNAGGHQIQKESDELINKTGPISVGNCKSTGAGNLPSTYIIHAVGPRWYQYSDKEEARNLLRSCIGNILREAENLEADVVSIPPISSGIFQYPKELCAKDILTKLATCLKEDPLEHLKEVRVAIIDNETFDVFEKKFVRMFGENPPN